METRRRTLLKGGAVTLGVLGLSACGGIGGTKANDSDGITVEVWDYLGQGVSDEAMKKVVDAFKQKEPTITIKRTSFAYADLSTSIVQGGVGGSVPDLAIVDVVDNQNFASLGLLAELGDWAEADSSIFFEGPLNSGTYEGRTHGLPLNSNCLALFINKKMLEETKLAVPTDWSSLADAATGLASNGRFGLAMSCAKNEQGTFQFLPFVWQTGGDLDTYAESGAEALAYVKSLVDDGAAPAAIANYSQEDARNQFINGGAAMMINGPWEIPNLEGSDIEFVVAPLPSGKDRATGLGGENVVVFEEAKQREAAEKFAAFLTSAEGAKIYCEASGQLSARSDVAEELASDRTPEMQVFADSLEFARARAYGDKYAEISAEVQNSLQLVLTDAASPKEAAAQAAKAIDSLLP